MELKEPTWKQNLEGDRYIDAPECFAKHTHTQARCNPKMLLSISGAILATIQWTRLIKKENGFSWIYCTFPYFWILGFCLYRANMEHIGIPPHLAVGEVSVRKSLALVHITLFSGLDNLHLTPSNLS